MQDDFYWDNTEDSWVSYPRTARLYGEGAHIKARPTVPARWEEKFLETVFEDELHELRFLKDMMKAAAQFTRDHLQDYHGDTPIIMSQQLSAIARAVWTQNHIFWIS